MASRVIILIIMLCCFLWKPYDAISGCGGPCRTLDDCYGQLICINGKCNDDPDVGTHICSTTPTPKTPPPPPPPPPPPVNSGTCPRSGTLNCQGISYPTYTCSPPVTSSTAAILTNNDFEEGGDGGGPSECDGNYHRNSSPIVALSMGWYSGGSRCFKHIRIRAANGRSVIATVVDECDSLHGCDSEHAYQPPCRNNIVDGSKAVWDALGLDVNVGEVPVTWTMV